MLEEITFARVPNQKLSLCRSKSSKKKIMKEAKKFLIDKIDSFFVNFRKYVM